MSDAPKDDDRLKTEDKKNEKVSVPTMEPVIEPKIIEQKIGESVNEQQGASVVTESVESLFASPIDDAPSEPNKILQNEDALATEAIQEAKSIDKMPEIPTMIEPVVEIIEPTQTEIIPSTPEQISENNREETVQTILINQLPEASIFTPEKTPEVIIPEIIVEKQTTIVNEIPQIQNTEVQIEEPATKIEDISISSQSVD